MSLVGRIRVIRLYRKKLLYYTVPETDTSELVKYTKALERIILKELGKIPA